MTDSPADPFGARAVSTGHRRRHRHHSRRRHRSRTLRRVVLVLGVLGALAAIGAGAAVVARRAAAKPRVTSPPGRFTEALGKVDPAKIAAAQYRPASATQTPAAPATPAPCDYYASPEGGGNGNTSAGPFKIANFWAVAAPGKTLCLMDGTYSGDGSMVLPPQNLNGAEGAPITVRAMNDGKVLLDGGGKQLPVQLFHNDWFVIDGIDACCSSGSVVMLADANHNVVRRVAAWDAADGNYEIFGAHTASYNLFEDVAGWGTARKIFQMSQGGNYVTVRRAWGRWERSTVVGPKMTYTLAYNNYHLICENCIGTWSGEKMPDSYVLLDYFGQPWTGAGAGTYRNGDVDQPIGIFGVDGADDKNADVRLLGSLAYVLPTDRYKANDVVWVGGIDAVTIQDTAVYIAPGTNPNVRPFNLMGLPAGAAEHLIAQNLTAFGGSSSTFANGWLGANVWTAATANGAYLPGESIFRTARGASLYYRYQDGLLTNQALWPWPMNQRIFDAMVRSGRTGVDVTSTVTSFFGEVPLVNRDQVVQPPPRRPTPRP